MHERRPWGEMRMSAADLADVTGSTYTYLMNGQPPAANWTGLFTPGERVRLRVINGSAMSYFDVRHPGLEDDGRRRRRPARCSRSRSTSSESRSRRPTTSSSSRRAGGVHDLRAGARSDRVCGRHACRAHRVACAGAGPRRAADADHGRHGTRRVTTRRAAEAARPTHAGHAMPPAAGRSACRSRMSAMGDSGGCSRIPARRRAIRSSTCRRRRRCRSWTIRASACGTTAGGCSPTRPAEHLPRSRRP